LSEGRCLYIVKRTQIYLDERQDRRLAQRANAERSTKSSLIRQAVDEFLARPAGTEGRLGRFREALHEASGVAPYLPEGSSYVEDLRRGDVARQRELDATRSA
jgi:predicted transcriptional regulator